MFDRLRTRLLRVLRVPPEPAPPLGAPGSLRVFRAGANLYRLHLLRWGLAQAGAVAGILFSLTMLHQVETRTEAHRERARAPATQAGPSAPTPAATPGVTPPSRTGAAEAARPRADANRPRSRPAAAAAIANWPSWVFPVLKLLEWAAIALLVVQIPITYAMVRLDFELRWYLVTDRSLRIRTGLTTVQESTMSFANVQQVVVTQGPLQRLLGIADLRVQSAGGGDEPRDPKAGPSLHTGIFHGVDNAPEIRDLILARLRQFRESGLGDPDEAASRPAPSAGGTPRPEAALAAAREVLAEARALRQVLR